MKAGRNVGMNGTLFISDRAVQLWQGVKGNRGVAGNAQVILLIFLLLLNGTRLRGGFAAELAVDDHDRDESCHF